jgi:hypothetical protein
LHVILRGECKKSDVQSQGETRISRWVNVSILGWIGEYAGSPPYLLENRAHNMPVPNKKARGRIDSRKTPLQMGFVASFKNPLETEFPLPPLFEALELRMRLTMKARQEVTKANLVGRRQVLPCNSKRETFLSIPQKRRL